MDLDFLRVVVALGFLFVAAVMDWRRRVVKDVVWITLGAAALAIVELELLVGSAAWFLHLLTAATAILYFGAFFGKEMRGEKRFTFRPLRFGAYLAALIFLLATWRLSSENETTLGAFYRLLTMPGMIVVAHGLYEYDLLRGGADAKALMALSLLFPGIYPHLGSFPIFHPTPAAEPIIAVTFPFAFVVLVDSALLFLAVPLFLLARNVASGTAQFPRALVGLRVPLDGLPKFAWFMDRVEDGEPVFHYFPRRKEDREEQVRLLREHGLTHVWVTPQLPFLVAMFVGAILAVVFGNLLLAFFAR